MQAQASFSAKIMLFGEYSILLGSPALSIPFSYFSAGLRIPSTKEDLVNPVFVESNRLLREYYNRFLSKPGFVFNILNIEHLLDDLESGLFLDSTIPLKYGAGSSGALCAALYSRYANDPSGQNGRIGMREMNELRRIFATMESWFHGKSSGLDPLVIYLRHPLII